MIFHFTDVAFWLYGLFAGLAFIVSFFLPGFFFVSRLKTPSRVVTIVLSAVLGIVLWGAQGFVFGYLQLRGASYIYLVTFLILFLHDRKKHLLFGRALLRELQNSSKIVVASIAVGTFVQILPVFLSGFVFPGGVEFFFTNAVDGIMHLTYIQSIARNFPPQEPSAVGLALVNYHYWSDLIQGELVRIWHLPTAHLFFQYMPILTATLIGTATYLLIRTWGFSRSAGLWALFFTFFGGDMTYVFTLVLHQKLNFETPVIDNGVTQFLNMPHVFAKLVFLTALIPFSLWVKTKQLRWLFLSVILFASLIGLKVYFGIFVVVGLSAVLGIQAVVAFFHDQDKKSLQDRVAQIFTSQWQIWAAFFVMMGIIAAIFLPTNKSAGGLFYSPLEWPKLFLGRDGINWQEWWQRRDVYAQFNNTRGLITLDVIAVAICLLCVYGSRMVGAWVFRATRKRLPWQILVFFGSATLVFTLLGLFTLQSSGLFNVFNFFAVACVGLTLFSGLFCAELAAKKNILARIALAAIVLCTLPRSVYEISTYIQRSTQNKYNNIFSPAEIAGLNFIRLNTKQTDVVQASLHNENDRMAPYVSFLSDRSTYLSGDGLLNSHNQPFEERKAVLKTIFNANSSQQMAQNAAAVGIDIIYLVKRTNFSERLSFTPSSSDFDTLFENDEVLVLRIKK